MMNNVSIGRGNRLGLSSRNRLKARSVRMQDHWATPGQSGSKIPKMQEHARLTMMDSTVLTGYVFVEATSRIQDVLNGETQFVPFIDDSEEIPLLNKASIMKVRPYDS